MNLNLELQQLPPSFRSAALDRKQQEELVGILTPLWIAKRKSGMGKVSSYLQAIDEARGRLSFQMSKESIKTIQSYSYYSRYLGALIEKRFPGWETNLPKTGGLVAKERRQKTALVLGKESKALPSKLKTLLEEKEEIEAQIQKQVKATARTRLEAEVRARIKAELRLEYEAKAKMDALGNVSAERLVTVVKEAVAEAMKLLSVPKPTSLPPTGNGSSHDNRVTDLYLKGVILDGLSGIETRLNERYAAVTSQLQILEGKIEQVLLELETSPAFPAPPASAPAPAPAIGPTQENGPASDAEPVLHPVAISGEEESVKKPRKRVLLVTTHPYPVQDQFPELDVTIEGKPHRITGKAYDLVVFMAAHVGPGTREAVVHKYGHSGFVSTSGGMEALASILEARLKAHRHH